MKIEHLNMVAVMADGRRYPIAACRPAPGEAIAAAVARQHAPHRVVVDARPWLVFCRDTASVLKWVDTNRMKPGQYRNVRRVSDVEGCTLQGWQFTAIGHWYNSEALRDAMTTLLMQSKPELADTSVRG